MVYGDGLRDAESPERCLEEVGEFQDEYGVSFDAVQPATEDNSHSTGRVTIQNIKVGMLVRQGPDWAWGNQGSRGVGVVQGLLPSGWATVKWPDSNRERNYRIGQKDKYDLCVSSPEKRVANSLRQPLITSSATVPAQCPNDDGVSATVANSRVSTAAHVSPRARHKPNPRHDLPQCQPQETEAPRDAEIRELLQHPREHAPLRERRMNECARSAECGHEDAVTGPHDVADPSKIVRRVTIMPTDQEEDSIAVYIRDGQDGAGESARERKELQYGALGNRGEGGARRTLPRWTKNDHSAHATRVAKRTKHGGGAARGEREDNGRKLTTATPRTREECEKTEGATTKHTTRGAAKTKDAARTHSSVYWENRRRRKPETTKKRCRMVQHLREEVYTAKTRKSARGGAPVTTHTTDACQANILLHEQRGARPRKTPHNGPSPKATTMKSPANSKLAQEARKGAKSRKTPGNRTTARKRKDAATAKSVLRGTKTMRATTMRATTMRAANYDNDPFCRHKTHTQRPSRALRRRRGVHHPALAPFDNVCMPRPKNIGLTHPPGPAHLPERNA
eukprot:GEMP01028276.1.p1 GENE.GEMP01028276.1~~GEMP01028276.1.p1  ORF type:complete len:566 (+),score=138.04 GEMP01028276.1:20-1717(+)